MSHASARGKTRLPSQCKAVTAVSYVRAHAKRHSRFGYIFTWRTARGHATATRPEDAVAFGNGAGSSMRPNRARGRQPGELASAGEDPVSEEDAVAGATSCRHAAAAAKQQTGHIFRVRVHARSGTAAMPQAACLQGGMSRCHPYLPCRAHRRAGTGRVRWQAACLCRVPRRRRPLGAGARGAGAPPCAAASA